MSKDAWRREMRAKDIPVSWTAWDVKPPYAHHFLRWLTQAQYTRYKDLQTYNSLSEACEYALKVGSIVKAQP